MKLRRVSDQLYRCFYVSSEDSGSFDPRRLTAWEIIRANERGRWDDPQDEFRVLYTAGAEVTALIEVLASLRPSKKTIRGIDEIDDPDDSSSNDDSYQARQEQARRAVDARLAPRYMAVLRSAPGPKVYDVLSGASRTELELHLDLKAGSLKTGDFAARDVALTQCVSRWVYENTSADGVYSMSAEDGNGYVTVFFEASRGTGILRIGEQLLYEASRRAAACTEALDHALSYLDITPSELGAPMSSSRERAGEPR